MFRAILFLLLLLLIVFPATSTNPAIINLRMTIRDFMWAECVKGGNYSENYCPNDTSIRAAVQAGQIGGHTDFEQYGGPGDGFYGPTPSGVAPLPIPFPRPNAFHFSNGPPKPYSTSVTFSSDCSGGFTGALVTPRIRFSTGGIPKPEYATQTLMTSLGLSYPVSDGQSPRLAYNNDSFYTWFNDNAYFSKRVAAK